MEAVLEIVGKLARREAASGEVRTFSPSLPKIVAAVYILGVLDRAPIIFHRDMRAVLLLSICGVIVWGAPTTVAPVEDVSSTIEPEKSSELRSATFNSNVTVAANATDVDEKIFPFNNQVFGLPFPGFQSAQSPFGNGYGLNPSFSPFQGNIYGQYPHSQNVFPQGLYSPQGQNPFYDQGPVQPAQVLGQPGQLPGNQGFQQVPLQLQGPIPQAPQGSFPQGQPPQGPFQQGQFPPNRFPQQQFPQNRFPQGQPVSPGSGNNDNSERPSAPNPASANGSGDPEANEQPQSENPSGASGQKEQQDGSPPRSENPGGEASRPNPSEGAGQLPGQFPAGYQDFPQTLTGSPERFRNGGPAFNQNFFSPSYQFLPNGQFLPQGFGGQLLTPGVFAGQGNGPTQLNPNQPQNPQGQGQLFQSSQGGPPQNFQSPQGFFPQGGFPPGFQGGYPQVPQGVFTQGPQGAFVPSPQGAIPQGAAPGQGPFQTVNPQNFPPPNPGPNPQNSEESGQGGANPADSPNSPDAQDGPSTQSRGVPQGDVTVAGGIVSDAPVRPFENFEVKRPIALPVKINPVTSMKIIPPPGPNQQSPLPVDQAPQPSQGSELRSPPGDMYNEVSAVEAPAKQTERTSNTDRPATRRPDP